MIGFALLGCGRIGRVHAGNIVGYARAELDRFIQCIETGTAPLSGFTEGREALRLADAVLESMASGRAVRLG